jgi:exodeoxyribonuclease V alpha subunit
MDPSKKSENKRELMSLEGTLEKIVFTNPSTDFTVGRLSVRGRSEPVTIVGALPRPHEGELLALEGEWIYDKKYGEQFRFSSAQVKEPSTVTGIRKYLSSNLIRGVGPEIAARITSKFGAETLDIIEKTPHRLQEVPGIGAKRGRQIADAFAEQKGVRDTMLFLQSHGVSSNYAYKIHKRYGQKAVEVVNQNPFVLATDIRGIGFHSADKIAGSLGIDMRSPLRAQAGLLHTLDEIQSEGHCYLPWENLLDRAWKLLSIDRDTLERALDSLARSRRVVIEEERVYPERMARMENSVATDIRNLISSPRFLPGIKIEAALNWAQQRNRMELSPAQRKAVAAALQNKVQIVTGGPGTGKTTLVRSVIQILEAKKLRICLAAPTGRAAKRLSEATNRQALTIHRLLEYAPNQGGFTRNRSRPVDAEFVIVDEASMVDITLMNYLLRALNPMTGLLLVGDVDQLPSVGPGNALRDLIDSGKVPVCRLDTIFRQAKASMIVNNAHRVNNGIMPEKVAGSDELNDFYIIEKEDPEEAAQVIFELAGKRIPDRFNFNPMDDLQVLSPMHKGSLGTENLNLKLRDTLNPKGAGLKAAQHRVGDRVMQTRNNYEKDVFNGDIGRIVSYEPEWEEAGIQFEDKLVTYHVSEMDELAPAYAVTIHKSQGSEYPAVIIPLTTQHYVMLKRNLLYTAMTRGKSLVVLVGSPRALKIAVENNQTESRFTRLAEKI